MDSIEFLEEIWKGFDEQTKFIGIGDHSRIQPVALSLNWKDDLRPRIQIAQDNRTDLFFSPAVFQQSAKQHQEALVHGSRVSWVDLDIPNSSIETSSLSVSSGKGSHNYWILDSSIIELEVLKQLNQQLAKVWQADSKFALNSFLRVPGTYNTKYDEPKLVEVTQSNLQQFSLPQLVDRSKLLWGISQDLGKTTANREQIILTLKNLDKTLGLNKYSDRPEEYERIANKTKIQSQISLPDPIKLEDVDSYTREINWVVAPLITQQSTTLLVGEPGTGKTQLSLYLGLNFACQTAVTIGGLSCRIPQRILFVSLEMSEAEIIYILKRMGNGYKNLTQPLVFDILCPETDFVIENDDYFKLLMEKAQDNYDGIIIDSLGEFTGLDLQSSAAMQKVFDRIDVIKKEVGCWFWIIHHQRKATAENKKTNKLSDVYGAQRISARSSAVFYLMSEQSLISLKALKTRFASQDDNTRVELIHFKRSIENGQIWFTQ